MQTAAFGTICGLVAAVGYTLCNSCLRAVVEVNPFFVAAMRAIPTILLLGPIVIVRPLQGLRMWPPLRVSLMLAGFGAVAHLAGNSLFQYSLGVVGMALAVPLCLGFMIVSGATLGRVILIEPITTRMALALLVLILSAFVLSSGARQAHDVMQLQESLAAPDRFAAVDNAPWWHTILGVGAACLSGLFYASLGATIRNYARDQSTVAQTLTIVSTAGLIVLVVVCAATIPLEEMSSYSAHEFMMMTLAGILNALAFIALTRALQLTALVRVHAMNASQAAMAAIAGVVFFHEAMSPYLIAGLVLTVCGLFAMQFAGIGTKSTESSASP